MKLERKFIQNYLSKPKFKNGVLASFLVLSLSVIASLFYWDSSFEISSLLSANYKNVILKEEYWRLFTTTFVHGGLDHLLSNSLMLFILIYFVSSFYGMFISIGLSFFMAMITNLIVIIHYGGEISLVGASGVVFYLWGFWMVLYFLIQRHMTFMQRFLRMGAVFLILLIPTEFEPSTSYLAHYIGFSLGLMAGLIYFNFKKSKLFMAEKWEEKYVSDELSPLDKIALSYSQSDESESNM